MPTVTFEVYDKGTQRAIPYVSVTLDSTVGATDPRGIVRFTVTQGTHNVMVRSPYHRPFTSSVEVQADSSFHIEIERAIII